MKERSSGGAKVERWDQSGYRPPTKVIGATANHVERRQSQMRRLVLREKPPLGSEDSSIYDLFASTEPSFLTASSIEAVISVPFAWRISSIEGRPVVRSQRQSFC